VDNKVTFENNLMTLIKIIFLNSVFQLTPFVFFS